MSAGAALTSAILRHVPSEIQREILLKLPIKSLLRFSTVSKSWHSMISESGFTQEHMRRGAVERMVTVSSYDFLDGATSVSRIPLASSTAIEDSTHLISPIEGTLCRLRAFSDGLWLVQAEKIQFFDAITPGLRGQVFWDLLQSGETEISLHLWNHSTRAHRKLPDSSLPTTRTRFVYGLGYDSAAEDYKVLKIARKESSDHPIQTEVYSLKSDSWKTISAPPTGVKQERCEFVNGAFHWLPTFSNTIISSFSLSSEKYREITTPAIALDTKYVEVVVMRGKLCVSVNSAKFDPDGFCFAMWVMEEYGVEKSWTKMLRIEYGNVVLWPLNYPICCLRPVHLYDNGDVLLNTSNAGLCMYENEGARFKRIVSCDGSLIWRGFIDVESLVSTLPESCQENNELNRVKT